jgi:subtilisin family serine protease
VSKHNSQQNGLLSRRAAPGAHARRSGRASRNWTFERLEERQLLAADAFAEPLLGEQWYLLNTGQQVGNPDFQEIYAVAGEDINVAPAWNMGYSGAGVIVAVVDSGVQTDHPDLMANIDPLFQFNFLDINDPAASPDLQTGNIHGTAVAGIIAAEANGIGTTGVAYDAQIVPVIRDADVFGTDDDGASYAPVFQLWQQGIDVFNHSYGPPDSRQFLDRFTDNSHINIAIQEALNDSIVFGREGLGVIHVWAAGDGGDLDDFSNYDRFANSRFTIAVTAVDHDGGYNNVDGTITNYGEAGPNVLVAAPSSSVLLADQHILDDIGIGSGIVTTDFTADYGANRSPLFSGMELDNDYLADVDYMSRFGGTSASTPMVSGVVALMLQANPELSWRDVQEILIRSARQNAAQEELAIGQEKNLGRSWDNTWIINRDELFRPVNAALPTILDITNPVADPTAFGLGGLGFGNTPDLYTNGAGYTISQGRGSFGEAVGYAHGVVDAHLAVTLAEQWHTKNQALPTELTYTTYVTGGEVIAAETVPSLNGMLIPGKAGGLDATGDNWGGEAGFGEYYECIADPECDLAEYEGPYRNGSYISLGVLPEENAMRVEWVEVQFTASNQGGEGDESEGTPLENLRMTLVSPDGTHSELNHHFVPSADIQAMLGSSFIDRRHPSNLWVNGNGSGPALPGTVTGAPLTQAQYDAIHVTAAILEVYPNCTNCPQYADDPHVLTVLEDGYAAYLANPPITPLFNDFIFTTNRHWGERYDSDPQIDPVTGEPYATSRRNGWQLHVENFSGEPVNLEPMEIVWHGSRINPDSARIQGSVGVDNNSDGMFNFERWIQSHRDINGDDQITRFGEVAREQDPDQESFASNITVKISHTESGELVDQFVTGADGNFYFDVLPDFYTIEIEDPAGRTILDDPNTPAGFLDKYKTSWEITPDYFNAFDHDRLPPVLSGYNPAIDYDIRVDGGKNPVPFSNPSSGGTVPVDLRGMNFLLERAASLEQATMFNGLVFLDAAGNGLFDPEDLGWAGVDIFADLNRNGQFDLAEEPAAKSLVDGTYSLSVPTSIGNVFEIIAVTPEEWTQTKPEMGSYIEYGKPGLVLNDLDFGMQPPPDTLREVFKDREIRVTGLVFADTNENGMKDTFESFQENAGIYADLNHNDSYDPDTEPFEFTRSDGSYELVLSTTEPVAFEVRVDIGADGSVTNPASGEVALDKSPGDTIGQVNFGIKPSATMVGRISGSVFHDSDGNGLRDGNDFAVPGFTVYLDGDQNGSWTTGEPQAKSDGNGNFSFSNVAPGNVLVRMTVAVEWNVTTPAFDYYQVSVSPFGHNTGLEFGVNNRPTVDAPDNGGGNNGGGNIGTLEFGDLLGFPTMLAQNGPYHQTVPGFQLGTFIDSELDGQPHPDGLGDDNRGIADDDGVKIVDAAGRSQDILGNPIPISPGKNRTEVAVQGLGGLLNGWMDFNGSGSFDTGEHIFDNLQLRPGRYVLPFNAPGNLADGPIAARFRWGEADLSFTGGSLFAGEVEDYMFETANGLTVTVQTGSGDYDGDGIVGPGDYNVWWNSFGSTTELAADGNNNGTIDAADYTIWQQNNGLVIGVGIISAVTDSDSLDKAQEELAPTTLVIGPLAPSVDVTAGDTDLVAASSSSAGETVDHDLLNLVLGPLAPSVDVTAAGTDVVAASSSSAGEAVDHDLLNLVLGQLGSQPDEEMDLAVLDASYTDDVDLALAVALDEETDWRLL